MQQHCFEKLLNRSFFLKKKDSKVNCTISDSLIRKLIIEIANRGNNSDTSHCFCRN